MIRPARAHRSTNCCTDQHSGCRPCSHIYISCSLHAPPYVGREEAHCIVGLCLCLLARSNDMPLYNMLGLELSLPSPPQITLCTHFALRECLSTARTENRVYLNIEWCLPRRHVLLIMCQNLPESPSTFLRLGQSLCV